MSPLPAVAQGEDVLPTRGEPVGPERDRVLVVLDRGDRQTRRNPADHRDPDRVEPTRPLLAGEHQGTGRPLAGDPPLEHALPLERLQMVESGAGREVELLADLADRGRHAVPLSEDADELQYLALPGCHLSHRGPLSRSSLNRIIVNTR